ncbi:MAG: c-type cytochrome [Zoogloeaceae bacterium]|nr:c-type cytochrome [Zoogloeaceae bacterium]
MLVSSAFVIVLAAFIVPLLMGGSGSPGEADDIEVRIAPVARITQEDLAASTAEAGAENATQGGEAAEPRDGATVYALVCTTCHDTGISGSPKKGDKEAWAPRIATGKEALYGSALAGKGVMPPRGGNSSLSDEEVKNAVDFLVDSAS